MNHPTFRTSILIAFMSSGVSIATNSAAEPAAQELSQRSVLIGGGVGFEPLYEGSKEHRGFPVPIISYSSGEPGPRRFEFRSLDDIRFHAMRFNRFSVGPIVGYRFGRDEDNSARLRGLGNIDGGLLLGGFGSFEFYQTDDVTLGVDVGISTQVTGDAFDEGRFAGIALPVGVRNRLDDGYGYGYEIDLGLSGEITVDDRLNITTRIGTIYASDEYMQTNFGVGVAQATAATALGNPIDAYDADAGIKNAYININAIYELTESIQLRAGAGYSRLLGDAADSTVTESKNQFSGTLGAAYRIKF